MLSPIQTLSAGGQDAENLQLALDATGDAVLVWQRSDGANVRIEARARRAAGVLGPVRTLSAAGQGASDPGLTSTPTATPSSAVAGGMRPTAAGGATNARLSG